MAAVTPLSIFLNFPRDKSSIRLSVTVMTMLVTPMALIPHQTLSVMTTYEKTIPWRNMVHNMGHNMVISVLWCFNSVFYHFCSLKHNECSPCLHFSKWLFRKHWQAHLQVWIGMFRVACISILLWRVPNTDQWARVEKFISELCSHC